MDEELSRRLDSQDKKLEAVYISVEKTRKYIKWTLILSVVFVVLPMIGLIFAIPQFLGTLNLGGLGL